MRATTAPDRFVPVEPMRVYPGLKRGNPITAASFMGLGASFIILRIPLRATGGGPLGGPTYQVEPVRGVDVWILRVSSPRHESWNFCVRDGETHHVWLWPR